MEDRFLTALKLVLNFEGGYSNDASDRGGETNYGITAGTLSSAHARGIVGHTNVKKLTSGEVASIYRKMYWEPAQCPTLFSPLDILMFDAAVNHGVGGAVKLLQETINAISRTTEVDVDGGFGPHTRKAYNEWLDVIRRSSSPQEIKDMICLAYISQRMEKFDRIADKDASQRKFLRGWIHQRCVNLMNALGLS